MIAAIADDLTGAAEIAGIGWRLGLDSRMLRRNQPPVEAGLVVYDSDSRNCTPAEAARRVAAIARRLQSQAPVWIYKKVDSVLRGHVVSEIEALLRVLELPRCLLVPANPSAGRVIRDGCYYIGGMPLDRTDFRNDPGHPRRSANVVELLGGGKGVHVACLSGKRRDLPTGLVVGDASSLLDLKRWASRVDADTLAAGGGEMFAALLAREGGALKRFVRSAAVAAPARVLFVCGSLSDSAVRFVAASRARGWPVLGMPAELFSGLASRREMSFSQNSGFESLNPGAAQTFLSASAGDSCSRQRSGFQSPEPNTGLESPVNRQTGMSALQAETQGKRRRYQIAHCDPEPEGQQQQVWCPGFSRSRERPAPPAEPAKAGTPSERGVVHGKGRGPWAAEITRAFTNHPKVVMTIGNELCASIGASRRLERTLAETACAVVRSAGIECVCVEGGATAAAFLDALQWQQLAVQQEYARGVTAVSVAGETGLTVVLKPGSYAWPGALLA